MNIENNNQQTDMVNKSDDQRLTNFIKTYIRELALDISILDKAEHTLEYASDTIRSLNVTERKYIDEKEMLEYAATQLSVQSSKIKNIGNSLIQQLKIVRADADSLGRLKSSAEATIQKIQDTYTQQADLITQIRIFHSKVSKAQRANVKHVSTSEILHKPKQKDTPATQTKANTRIAYASASGGVTDSNISKESLAILSGAGIKVPPKNNGVQSHFEPKKPEIVHAKKRKYSGIEQFKDWKEGVILIAHVMQATGVTSCSKLAKIMEGVYKRPFTKNQLNGVMDRNNLKTIQDATLLINKTDLKDIKKNKIALAITLAKQL